MAKLTVQLTDSQIEYIVTQQLNWREWTNADDEFPKEGREIEGLVRIKLVNGEFVGTNNPAYWRYYKSREEMREEIEKW